MGAMTFTQTGPARYWDNKRCIPGTLTPSASYATGGDSFAVATQGAGLNRLDGIYLDAANQTALATSGISVVLAGTPAVPLIKVFDLANTEATATNNYSARPLAVVLVGS